MNQSKLPGSRLRDEGRADIAVQAQDGELERQALDIQVCWDQVLRVQPCFRLTWHYASAGIRVGLLALNALLAALEEAYCGVTDEAVSQAKLAWWQNELLYSQGSVNSHPIVRQMSRAGMLEIWQEDTFPALLDFWLARNDALPPADARELRLLCERIGWPAVKMELSLQGETVPDDCRSFLQAEAAISGMVQLFRESCRSVRLGYWWIPLDSRARRRLSRSDLASPERASAIGLLLRELCEVGLGWRSGIASTHPFEREWRRRNRHMLTRFFLAEQQLAHLKASQPGQYRKQFSRVHLADALAAWRGARTAVAGQHQRRP